MKRLITFWEIEAFNRRGGKWKPTGYVTFDPEAAPGIIRRLKADDIERGTGPYEYRVSERAGTCPHCHEKIYQRHLKISS